MTFPFTPPSGAFDVREPRQAPFDDAPELTTGILVSKTFDVWWSNVFRFAGLTLLTYVPLFVAAVIMVVGVGRHGPGEGWVVRFAVVVGVLMFLAAIVQMGALTYGAVQELADRDVRFGTMLAAGFGRFFPVLGAGLLGMLAILAGYALLIVPGIIFACALTPLLPAVVAERIGPIAGIRRSWDLTRGYRWTIFKAWFVIALVSVGVALLLLLVGRIPVIGVFFDLFVRILFNSLGLVLPAVVYHRLRLRKEGASTAELARVFE